jgi:hypothetical protein
LRLLAVPSGQNVVGRHSQLDASLYLKDCIRLERDREDPILIADDSGVRGQSHVWGRSHIEHSCNELQGRADLIVGFRAALVEVANRDGSRNCREGVVEICDLPTESLGPRQ